QGNSNCLFGRYRCCTLQNSSYCSQDLSALTIPVFTLNGIFVANEIGTQQPTFHILSSGFTNLTVMNNPSLISLSQNTNLTLQNNIFNNLYFPSGTISNQNPSSSSLTPPP